MHVHHLYYESGLMPWEYPDSALITLCPYCHRIEHERFDQYIGPERDFLLRKEGFRAKDYEDLVFEMVGNLIQFDNGDPIDAVKKYIKRRKMMHREQIERFHVPGIVKPESDLHRCL